MGPVSVVFVLLGSLLIGLIYQLLGHARERYEWQIAMVGALYGELAASGIVGPTPGFGLVLDGLNVLPALLGGLVVGGLMVVGVRTFGSPLSTRQRVVAVAEVTCTRRVRLSYSPELLREPIIYHMTRQFGVSAAVGSAEIRGSRGWVELEIVGAPAAVEAGLDYVQRSGVPWEPSDQPRRPATLVA